MILCKSSVKDKYFLLSCLKFKDMAKNSVKKALLRLPEPLWKSLKRTAKKENRSMHGQILEILEEAQKPKTPMMVSITEINDAQTRTANSSTGITIPEPETVTV